MSSTKLKKMEVKLSESEIRLSQVLYITNAGMWDINLKTGDMYLCPQFFKLLGYEKGDLAETADGLKLIHHPDEWKKMWDEVNAHLKGQTDSYVHEHRLLMKCGEWKWILTQGRVVHYDDDGVPERLIGVATDISKRKKSEEEKMKLESELRQAHKMEAVGMLAGGIAHDFNNILGIILGNTEMSLVNISKQHPGRHFLEAVISACHRGKDVIQQLLSFTRKSDQNKKAINIIPIIKESFKLLRSSTPTNIIIRLNITAESDIIIASPTQIHQIIINLCTNATHAMSEKGGILEISLKNEEFDQKANSRFNSLSQKYVKMSVSDTGCGISSKIQDRIFEPYFTTKEVGEGSGMGLAVIHGIVEQLNGVISLNSEPQKGTDFHILLPVAVENIKAKTKFNSDIPLGNERILFVDDEEYIADIGKQILEQLGYQVETALNPVRALKQFRIASDQFDLVITDMTMPEMTGD
ncbi:MAG: PAS domain-containing protein, partial [Deltaproteobacteria bacterium]|nr:PAS domain-containing protein [Deltaproteobacteria bacterium]